jgi:hypothetical protein
MSIPLKKTLNYQESHLERSYFDITTVCCRHSDWDFCRRNYAEIEVSFGASVATDTASVIEHVIRKFDSHIDGAGEASYDIQKMSGECYFTLHYLMLLNTKISI